MNEFTQLFFKELRNGFHKKMESSEFNQTIEMTELNIEELYNMNQKLNQMIEIIKSLNNTSLKVLQKDLKVPVTNITTPILTNNKDIIIEHEDESISNDESTIMKKTKYPFEIEDANYYDTDSNNFLVVNTKDEVDLEPIDDNSKMSKYFIQDQIDTDVVITVTPHAKNWKEGYEKQYKNTKNARIA